MAYIIITDRSQRAVLETAAAFLEGDGHRVSVTDDGEKVFRWIQEAPPDIMVLAGLTKRRDGMEILQEFNRLYPNRPVGVVLITVFDAVVPGRPLAAWGNPWVDSYLIGPCSSWQIVLAVEQLIYRRVTFPPEALLQIRLLSLASALMLYANDHQGKLPKMDSVESLRLVLATHESNFVSPLTRTEFRPNSHLSERDWKTVATTAPLAFYEATSNANGQRWIVRLGGQLWSPRPQALHISNAEFEVLAGERHHDSGSGA